MTDFKSVAKLWKNLTVCVRILSMFLGNIWI